MIRFTLAVVSLFLSTSVLAKDVTLRVVDDQNTLNFMCYALHHNGKARSPSIVVQTSNVEILACYNRDGWRAYTIVALKDETAEYFRTLEHECKHVDVGRFHEVDENGDETDLWKYAPCAQSLIETGRYSF